MTKKPRKTPTAFSCFWSIILVFIQLFSKFYWNPSISLIFATWISTYGWLNISFSFCFLFFSTFPWYFITQESIDSKLNDKWTYVTVFLPLKIRPFRCWEGLYRMGSCLMLGQNWLLFSFCIFIYESHRSNSHYYYLC